MVIILFNSLIFGIMALVSLSSFSFYKECVLVFSLFGGVVNLVLLIRKSYYNHKKSEPSSEILERQKAVMTDLDEELKRRRKEDAFIRN